jgi:hypothetical protein
MASSTIPEVRVRDDEVHPHARLSAREGLEVSGVARRPLLVPAVTAGAGW